MRDPLTEELKLLEHHDSIRTFVESVLFAPRFWLGLSEEAPEEERVARLIHRVRCLFHTAQLPRGTYLVWREVLYELEFARCRPPRS